MPQAIYIQSKVCSQHIPTKLDRIIGRKLNNAKPDLVSRKELTSTEQYSAIKTCMGI